MTLDEAIKNQEEIIESCREKINDVKFISKTRLGRDIIDIQSGYIQECEQYIEWLKELKQLRAQTEWISVNERLPESDGYYTVMEKSGRVGTYVFHNEGNSEEYWKRNAVAWKPRSLES